MGAHIVFFHFTCVGHGSHPYAFFPSSSLLLLSMISPVLDKKELENKNDWRFEDFYIFRKMKINVFMFGAIHSRPWYSLIKYVFDHSCREGLTDSTLLD